MEYWVMGKWSNASIWVRNETIPSKNQYSNIPPFHYPIWPTWNMFHIKILLFQHVIEVPIHAGSISGPYRISVFSIVCIAPKLPYSIVSDRCIGYNGE